MRALPLYSALRGLQPSISDVDARMGETPAKGTRPLGTPCHQKGPIGTDRAF
jgi:hypothetical protein